MNQTAQTPTPLTDAIIQCRNTKYSDPFAQLIVFSSRLERALAKANADNAVLVGALVKIDNTANASIPTAKKLARISEQARAALSQVQA